ncbi:MAG: nucleoside recognition protein [Clostridia bacterium]|nr:nucleoside recognition protein [Clostridia bacterium]
MNVIFTAVFLLSAICMLICAPEDFLPALLDGGTNALKCAVTLFTVYAVWMGLSAVAEDSKLTQKAARLLSPVCRKAFKTDDPEAVKCLSMNISCNLLGIGGAATPYGVRAIEALEKKKNYFAQNLLFIINATSIQIIPTTVIALRAAAGSASAHDIVIPSLIATIVSTSVAVTIFVLIEKLSKARKNRRGKAAKCNT